MSEEHTLRYCQRCKHFWHDRYNGDWYCEYWGLVEREARGLMGGDP